MEFVCVLCLLVRRHVHLWVSDFGKKVICVGHFPRCLCFIHELVNRQHHGTLISHQYGQPTTSWNTYIPPIRSTDNIMEHLYPTNTNDEHENNIVLPTPPEANLAFARKFSDIAAADSHGIYCHTKNKNEHFVSR